MMKGFELFLLMKKKLWIGFILIFLFSLILSVCKKKEELPEVKTLQVTEVSDESALLRYQIISDGGALIRQHGVCWDLNEYPTVFLNTKTMNGSWYNYSDINENWVYGLDFGSTYHVRGYATNSIGTAYGEDVTFSTKQIDLPDSVTTKIVGAAGTSMAIGGGTVYGYGGASYLGRGLCWSINPDPTIESSIVSDTIYWFEEQSFTGIMSGLMANTKYFVRAFGTNRAGVIYGNQVSFNTGSYTASAEGKLYNSVSIGTQVWMTENLAVTKFNDGTSIPLVTNQNLWNTLEEPAYCWFDNDKETNGPLYGALYNWYAVNTGKLCPAGWHVPSETEWTNLTTYLGADPGNKLISPGIMIWTDYPDAPDYSLFSAVCSGTRDTIIGFNVPGECTGFQDCHWWSSDPSGGSTAYSGWLYESQLSLAEFSRKNGYSVRCIKN
jgi:uncharacterized protein (TIGR02145 family)